MKYLTRDEVDPRTWTDCKLEYFLFHFSRHYSFMLLVLMSVEKCYAVYFPLKSKTVITNFAIVLKFMTAKCQSNQTNSTESINQALQKAATRGTAMVVTVSVTFLILTAPGGLNYAIRPLIHLSTVPEYRIFMNITTYLNHSINGVLYCIVGTRFRRELFKLFCRNDRETSFSSFSSGNSTRVSNISNINKN